MPIQLERHLKILRVAERLDALQATLRRRVEAEIAAVRAGAETPQEALENLDLLTRPEFIETGLRELQATLLVERQFYSNARVKAAARQRRWQRTRRGMGEGEDE